MDGQLVLRNGTIMEDPGDDVAGGEKEPTLANEDTVVDEDGDILCVECEDVEASRHCEQCEDNFCDECYDEKHGGGKRQHHTWKPMGPLRCMECEKNKATRWCVQCDDPYCMGCFQVIHAKGKKALHEWTKVGHGRESNATYDEYLQSEEYEYTNYTPEDTAYNDTTATQQEVTHEHASYDQTYENDPSNQPVDQYDQAYEEDPYAYPTDYQDDAQDYTSQMDWETHYDDAGTPYYFNPTTGETSWEMPNVYY